MRYGLDPIEDTGQMLCSALAIWNHEIGVQATEGLKGFREPRDTLGDSQVVEHAEVSFQNPRFLENLGDSEGRGSFPAALRGAAEYRVELVYAERRRIQSKSLLFFDPFVPQCAEHSLTILGRGPVSDTVKSHRLTWREFEDHEGYLTDLHFCCASKM